MAEHALTTSRRILFAATAAASAATLPAVATTAPDARLLALLAESRAAEADYTNTPSEDGAALDAASERLEEVLAAMAETPAESLIGVAAKAARLCRSLRDSGMVGEWGCTVTYADVTVARSLAEDLARLRPEVVA